MLTKGGNNVDYIMNKLLTFKEYWKSLGIDNDFKPIIRETWNAAITQAVKIVNNTEEQYEESVFLDRDILVDIAADIEGLSE